MNNLDKMNSLEKQLNNCTSGCIFGRTFVPATGPQPANLMIIGEAPGMKEVVQGVPFVGRAGKVLDTCLIRAGITRRHCRLANTCCCVDLEREKKTPLPAEIEACRPVLLADIAKTEPRCIVAMGNIAIELFFPGLKITKAQGKFRVWNGVPVIATFHPSFALRREGGGGKVTDLIVDDLIKAKEVAS